MNKNSDKAIQVFNISKSFGNVQAINNISFDVTKGEVFGLLGPNGAGKTTLLSIIEGLICADKGQVHVLGKDINKNKQKIKQLIGVQLQSTSLLPDINVYDQILLFFKLYGYQPNKDEIFTLLRLVGLTDKASVMPINLSGGQKQRLALAIALINKPEIIFLDEPTNGLDPQARRVLWDIIRMLQKQGKTIVLTTHSMDEAEILCNRIGIIDYGNLIALDAPGTLINFQAHFSTIITSDKFSLSEIKSLPNIQKFQVNSNLLYLQTNNVTLTLRSILDIAELKEISLNNLHIKQPNLEDVFLNLTGHTIRN